MNMRRPLLIAVFLALASTSIALDLTPQWNEIEVEAMHISRVRFIDEDRNVAYVPPVGWKLTGSRNRLIFTPPDQPQAKLEFRIITMTPKDREQPVDPKLWCQRFFPKETVTQKCTAELPSPTFVIDHPTQEYIFELNLPQETRNLSVLIADLSPTERLVSLVESDPQRFKALRDRIVRSLFSFICEQ